VVNRQSSLMATDQNDGTVALVDLRTLRPAGTLPPRDGHVANALAFLPDGRRLLVGGINGRVTIWNMRTHLPIRDFRIGDPVWWVAASPNGRLLATQTQANGSPDSEVEVRDMTNGKVLQRHRVRFGNGGVYFSDDGRELAALGCCSPGSTVVAWDARSGRQLYSNRNVPGHATTIAFSPNSRVLAVGTGDGKVELWDSRNGSPQGAPFQVAAGDVDQIAFSPDNHLFAAGSIDQSATLWDVAAHRQIGSGFPTKPGTIPGVLFEPNGDLLIMYLSNAAEWPTDLAAWQRFACQVAGRTLTRAEWAAELPDQPYRRVCPG
jgi:WD40 repeat protein